MTRADLLTLLLRLEWQGDDVHWLCPSCRQNRMHGHASRCELQKAITALAKLEAEKVQS